MHNKSNKTILISSYAPPSLGGPQNLYNLLRDIDPDSYCILTSFYNIDNISAKIGTWLKGEYIFYDSISSEKKITPSIDVKISSNREIIYKLKNLARRSKFIRNVIGIFIILIQIIAIISRGKKAIKKKKIDSIVGFSDYGPAMIGSYLLHKITKKSYSIFLFDIYKGNFFPFPGNFLAKIFEPLMFKSAKNIIVTNEGTKDFYSKRYSHDISKKIIVIHNSIFEEPYLKIEKYHKSEPPYTVIFTGRIYWPQIEALKNLIEAISEIKDMEIKLKIYSPHPKEYFKEIGIAEAEKVEIGIASPEEIPEIQSNANILFYLFLGMQKAKQL